MGGSMSIDEIFNALFNGGSFSLPYLIKLFHPDYGALYYINDVDDLEYNGNLYKASSFKYTKPQTIGGVLKNGSLEITAIDNNVIDIIEVSNELFTVSVIGAIDDNGAVTPMKFYKHQYCTVNTDEQMKIKITFTNDDRPDMVFPPDVFDNNNNIGNA